MNSHGTETGTITEDRFVRDAPQLPGLRFRRYGGLADVPGIVAVGHAANIADSFDYLPTIAELTNEIEHHDGYEPAEDILLAEIDGRIVGHGQVKQVVRDDDVTFELHGDVHPDFRRRGIGRTILRAGERRARQRALEAGLAGRVRLASWGPDSSSGHGALMRAEGYEAVRFFIEMIKRDLTTPPPRPLPPGLEMRPATQDNLRAIFDAENEAFRDHWGHMEWTDARFRETASFPGLDLSLWRVAWAGDEVAGVVATYIFEDENTALGISRGWTERISVRRPWRGKGVATALILSACEGLREHGIAEAALGVDIENPTGALGLYESLGFVKHSQATSWRKDLAGGAAL